MKCLRINKFPQCGLGNRIMYYYYMRIQAMKREMNYSCVSEKTFDVLFDDSYKGLVSDDIEVFKKQTSYPRFFEGTSIPLRQILPLKSKLKKYDNTTAVLHFRGTDYNVWMNGRGLMPAEYYQKGIDIIEKETNGACDYKFCSDDYTLKCIPVVDNYLREKYGKYRIDEYSSKINSITEDFLCFGNADWIIAAPSTYSITASMYGKESKKIIQSKDWFCFQQNRDLNHKGFDKEIVKSYWKDLYDCSRTDYRITYLI